MNKKIALEPHDIGCPSDKKVRDIFDVWPRDWIDPIVEEWAPILFDKTLDASEKTCVVRAVVHILIVNQVPPYDSESDEHVYNRLNILKSLFHHRLSTLDCLGEDPSLISWCRGYVKLLSFSRQIESCEMLLEADNDLIRLGKLESEAAYIWNLVDEMNSYDCEDRFFIEFWPQRLIVFLSEHVEHVYFERYCFDREDTHHGELLDRFKIDTTFAFFNTHYDNITRQINVEFIWTQYLPPFKEVSVFVESCVDMLSNKMDPSLTIKAEFCLLATGPEYTPDELEQAFDGVDESYVDHPILVQLSELSNNHLQITLGYDPDADNIEINYDLHQVLYDS